MRIATIQGPLQIGLDYSRDMPAGRANRLINPQLDERHPHNIGDWFVTTSSDRILDYDEAVLISRDAPQEDWDALNAECDVLVLKGGNYVQHDWLSQQFGLELFSKVKIPIFLFGIGLQAGRAEKVDFAPEEAEIWRLLSDRSAAISVRGGSTAEALSSIGISNAVVTGCPTTYWSLEANDLGARAGPRARQLQLPPGAVLIRPRGLPRPVPRHRSRPRPILDAVGDPAGRGTAAAALPHGDPLGCGAGRHPQQD